MRHTYVTLWFACAMAATGCGPGVPAGENDLAMAAGDGGAADLGSSGCSPKCSGLTPLCNATQHCVACLTDGDCAMGSYCKIISDAAAICTPGCMSDDRCGNGQKCCGNLCSDPMSDVRNCGGCGMACSGAHSTATCIGGVCASGKCDTGWGDCNKDGMDGCEANLHADPNNCTGCGMVCAIPNAFAGCADGCYATACKFGFDDCNLNAMDGCETSVLTDKANCGACGKPCLNLPNATASCTQGSCLLGTCNGGYANCDQMAANGCESKTSTDVNNCGMCGNVCPMGNICVGGGCTCPMCNIPNASAKCINNMCVFDQCNPGFADCDNNKVNGCEVDLRFDRNNCSQCGMVCPLNQTCSVGQCIMATMSCLAIKQGNPNAVDGMYTIDPDGNGNLPPVQVFCDMAGGGQTVWQMTHHWGEWGMNMTVVMRDGLMNTKGTLAEWKANCMIFGKQNYAGGWKNNGGTYSQPMYKVFADSQDWWNNYALKVFPTAKFDQFLIMQDALSPGCNAWYAEAGSLQSFGSPVGAGYAFCRGGDNAMLRYHIYLCL